MNVTGFSEMNLQQSVALCLKDMYVHRVKGTIP